MKKIITVIVLILAIMMCGACATPQQVDDLQSQTAELEKAIESQQKLIEQMQSMLNDNALNSASMQENIRELQKQNDLYKAQLRNLSGVPIEFTAEEPIYGPREGGKILSFNRNQEFVDYFEENHPCDD